MDLRTTMQGEDALVEVDLLEDAGSRLNNASVTAEVLFVAADSLGSALKPIALLTLSQSGPGLYAGHFRPDQTGVYLVRAQAGSDMVSAGLVHQFSSEASLGTVNERLISEAVKTTGGQLLATPKLPNMKLTQALQFTELWPPLVVALLILFLIDVGIRRWEHVTGLWERLTGR